MPTVIAHHTGKRDDGNDKSSNHDDRRVVQENWVILRGPGAGFQVILFFILLLSFTCLLAICVGLVYITFVAPALMFF